MQALTYKIGVDLGGTKIEIILLNPENQVLHRKRVPTPKKMKEPYRAILHKVHQLIVSSMESISEKTTFSIGIGIPGIYDEKNQKVINANTTCLIGQPFKRDLEQLLLHPVGMENDANCFAMAEAALGAAKGYRNVFGIILGSGCGGGIIIDGKVYHGRHMIAGEWGHFALDPQGEPCYCGNTGCIETKLSGNGVAKAHEKRYHESIPFETIILRYQKGDPQCRKTVVQFLDDFGRCVGGIISILDPDAIVIGGGVSNFDELYTTGAEKARGYALFDSPTTPILKHQLGDSAGVYGAAWIGV